MEGAGKEPVNGTAGRIDNSWQLPENTCNMILVTPLK